MLIKGSDYDMIILCEGDIYCNKDQVDDASGYYADDNNYEWYAVVETDDDVIEYAIDVTVDDMAFFNSVENLPKEKAIFFEEISEKIGDAPRFFIYQYIWFS